MRDYARVSPRFWTGETGRRLRGKPNLQIVTFYLITNPSTNMIGLYYLPLPTIAHETGITGPEVAMAMKRLRELGVAYYDANMELVFIPSMARFQIGETLNAKDSKTRKGVERQLAAYLGHPFFEAFFALYQASYGLERPNSTPSKGLRRGFEGFESLDCIASEGEGVGDLFTDQPLRTQEQDQGKDQSKEQEQASGARAPAESPGVGEPEPAAWTAHEWLRRFGIAWCKRYGTVAYGSAGDTIATGRLHDLLMPLPAEERSRVQAEAGRMFSEFLASGDPKCVERRHPWSFFVQDFGGLRVPKVAAATAPPRPSPESFAERDARVKAEQRERERQQTERAVTATDKKAAEYREWTR